LTAVGSAVLPGQRDVPHRDPGGRAGGMLAMLDDDDEIADALDRLHAGDGRSGTQCPPDRAISCLW